MIENNNENVDPEVKENQTETITPENMKPVEITANNVHEQRKKDKNLRIIIISVAAFIILLLAIIMIFIFYRKQKVYTFKDYKLYQYFSGVKVEYEGKVSITNDGEIAIKRVLSLNTSAIEKEAQYDGFYAVCTTLEDDISEIIKVNKRRWEIEESFRILKTDFKARPVYLKRDDRIKAHFTTCFLSLLIYRILENKLENKYSTKNIINTLQEMNSLKIIGCGYKQIYQNTDITRDLSKSFNIDINQDFISLKNMKKIFKNIK